MLHNQLLHKFKNKITHTHTHTHRHTPSDTTKRMTLTWESVCRICHAAKTFAQEWEEFYERKLIRNCYVRILYLVAHAHTHTHTHRNRQTATETDRHTYTNINTKIVVIITSIY